MSKPTSNSSEIKAAVKRMANVYHWTLNQDELNAYAEDLRDYEVDEIEQAVKKHRTSAQLDSQGQPICQFPPKSGVLLTHLRLIRKDAYAKREYCGEPGCLSGWYTVEVKGKPYAMRCDRCELLWLKQGKQVAQ